MGRTNAIANRIRHGLNAVRARLAEPRPTETTSGFCPVCGNRATFASYEPVTSPCKRNTFICSRCGSCARNRHVAQAILDRFSTSPPSRSLTDFAPRFDGTIWQTSTYGAIADALRTARNFTGTEFIDDTSSGRIVDGVRHEDIQASSFADASLDLVITEDVLEHVPSPDAAFAEIRRVLKPGGFHIGTIPVNWDRAVSVPRAVIEDGTLRHILPPEYHVDPTRRDGVLAFTEYGQDIVTRYCAMIGPSEILEANGDRELERDFAIYNSWVFVSRKPAGDAASYLS
jgi:SAM-dependent methyltransferase